MSKRVHLMNSSSEIDDLGPEGEDANNYCPAEVSESGRPNCAACKDFKTHRAVTALVVSVIGPYDMLAGSQFLALLLKSHFLDLLINFVTFFLVSTNRGS